MYVCVVVPLSLLFICSIFLIIQAMQSFKQLYFCPFYLSVWFTYWQSKSSKYSLDSRLSCILSHHLQEARHTPITCVMQFNGEKIGLAVANN